MKKANGFISKKDFKIIVFLAAAAFLSCLPLFFMQAKADKIVVSDDKKQLFSVDLSEIDKGSGFQKEFMTPNGKIVFEFVKDKGVRVVHSDCPDHICMKAGFIRKPRQIIVCLPLRVYAEIESGQGGGIDATVR